jgi:hypothetical protein
VRTRLRDAREMRIRDYGCFGLMSCLSLCLGDSVSWQNIGKIR